jgi:hypothetical protein
MADACKQPDFAARAHHSQLHSRQRTNSRSGTVDCEPGSPATVGSGKLIFLPAARGGLASYFGALSLSKRGRPRLSAHTPQRHGGGILSVIRYLVLDVARRDPADHDGALVSVGGALFAFWAMWHLMSQLATFTTQLQRGQATAWR